MEVSRKDEGNSVAVVTERAKPTLVMIGDRQVISSGLWNDSLMADYVLANGRLKWIPVGELAKVAYGQNIRNSKKRVRRRLSTLLNELLLRGEFLVIEYGPPHNHACTVKLFHEGSDVERQAVHLKLEKMRKRQVMTAEQYEMALTVIRKQVPESGTVMMEAPDGTMVEVPEETVLGPYI